MSQFIYLWYNIGAKQDLFRLTGIDLAKEAVLSLVASLIIGNLVFAFLEAPIQNILFYLTGMDRKKAKLKQDCSTARLSSDIQEQMTQEQILLEQANGLFKQNEKLKNPSINVRLFDENSNHFLRKASFEV